MSRLRLTSSSRFLQPDPTCIEDNFHCRTKKSEIDNCKYLTSADSNTAETEIQKKLLGNCS